MASPSERMTRRQGAPTTMTHELLLLALGHEGAAWLADQAASVEVARRRGRPEAECRLDLRDLLVQALERTERCACTVCGGAATTGHEHTSEPLCGSHAAWWSEALTERTSAADWDAEGDLRTDAHDALVEEMREDHEASLVPVMRHDPLDGLSLYGVGGAA